MENEINEPQRRCDYCQNFFYKEEMFNHDDLDICESCHEGAIA